MMRVQTHPKERGAALIVGMIILTIMAIAGLTMMNSTIQDERKTSNARARLNAFLAAEAGMQAARDYLVDNWDSYSCVAGSPLPSLSSVEFDAALATQYSVTVSRCNSDSIDLVSLGSQPATEALRSIAFSFQNGTEPSAFEPPAAISCLGGPCNIETGNGSDAPIDGRDHPVPDDGCSGSSCWTSYLDGEDSIPSIYLADTDFSTLTGASGSKKNAFCGQDSDNPASSVCGNDIDAGSVWGDDDYALDDETGESTAPTDTQYFGDDGELTAVMADASEAEFGTWDDPEITLLTEDTSSSGNSFQAGYLVVDGADYSRSGTGVYAGLVLITNCGTITTSGNFVIYGAIIVDSSDCGVGYEPVTGKGTIDVKYSSEALEHSGAALFSSDPYITDWQENIDRG